MHEATIASLILENAKNLLESSSSEENRRQDRAITKVVVEIGQFRNVEPESLLFAFDAMKKESSLTSQARLQIKLITPVAICSSGGHQYKPEQINHFGCNLCKGGIKEFIKGKELDIVSIESTEIEQQG